MDTFNPYSTEIRYSLDMMGYLLHAKKPLSVRIYSDSIEMVQAVVRRLAYDDYHLFVASQEICTAIQASLNVAVQVAGTEPADAALVPLSLSETLPHEKIIVGAVRNALSYKSLLHPGSIRTHAFAMLARIKREFHVDQLVGMYPPRFVAMLGLAHLMQRWSEANYFLQSDRAMQYLYEFGPLWRFCYVVIYAGCR